MAKERKTGRKFLPSKLVLENRFIVMSILSVGKQIIWWFRGSNTCSWDTVTTITTYIKGPSVCKHTLSFIAQLYFWWRAGNSVTRTAKTSQRFVYFSACWDFAAFMLLTGFGWKRGRIWQPAWWSPFGSYLITSGSLMEDDIRLVRLSGSFHLLLSCGTWMLHTETAPRHFCSTVQPA